MYGHYLRYTLLHQTIIEGNIHSYHCKKLREYYAETELFLSCVGTH